MHVKIYSGSSRKNGLAMVPKTDQKKPLALAQNWTNVHVCAHALAYDSVRVHVKLKGCWFSSKRIFGNLKKNLSISLTSMTTQSKKYYRQSGLPLFDSLILDSPGRFGDLRYLDEGCWGMLHPRISKQNAGFHVVILSLLESMESILFGIPWAFIKNTSKVPTDSH